MKFLRRFCSEQVQILLERMDDHWVEEFAIDGSKWEPMLPHGRAFEQFTRIEQRCIRDTAQEQTTKWKKERAYTGILERTMSPTRTRWEFDDEKNGRGAQPSQLLTTASMRKQMESLINKQFSEEYAKYRPEVAKNSFTGTLQQHAQHAQAEQAQKYMQNVQFELNQAHDVAELEAIMLKQKYLLEHEKHVIEHQQFLKQHAPRGYI